MRKRRACEQQRQQQAVEPSAEHPVLADDRMADLAAQWRAGAEEAEQRYTQLRLEAQAIVRAFDGWASIKNADEWLAIQDEADNDYQNGAFLIRRLGAERYLDPYLMAVLMHLRRTLVAEHGATTAAELMLIDCAVLAFYNTLRVQEWIGNLALAVEADFFGRESPTPRLRRHHSVVDGFRAEDHAQRIAEQLMPLLDRANKMLIRNLKALRELRQPPMPAVAIGQAGQVNVAGVQLQAAALPSNASTSPRQA